jgi:uncharacterized protein (DUF302 family)
MRTKYGFGKAVPYAVDEALKRVTEALQEEGLGVLSETDVAEAMKRKLNVEMPPYHILAAWSAPLTRLAIEHEPPIGLILPCNILVRQDGAGHVHVEFMDPDVVMQLVDRPEIVVLAREMRQRLERVMHVI